MNKVISTIEKRAARQKKIMARLKVKQRTDVLFDGWSIVHLVTGILLGWIMAPFVALLLMVLWEPLEILILSPLLAKFGITFGYETLRNSLSDIFFDAAGVVLGSWALTALVAPPFHLF